MPIKKFSLNDKNDPSAVKTNLYYDDTEKKIHIENTQDVEEIIKANKVAQNEGAYKSKSPRRIASTAFGIFF